MIKILYRDTRSAPIFVCDICGDMIGDCSLGAAVFPDARFGKANEKVEVLHVHKGKCHDLAEERFNDGRDSGWQELASHMFLLMINSEFTEAKLAEQKLFWESGGLGRL